MWKRTSLFQTKSLTLDHVSTVRGLAALNTWEMTSVLLHCYCMFISGGNVDFTLLLGVSERVEFYVSLNTLIGYFRDDSF